MTRFQALAVPLFCLFSGPAEAAEQVLILEPAATEITFSLTATGHVVEGRLFLEAGEVRFDLDSGEAGGRIAIDARKADTGNKRRDKTMHSKVLESDRFTHFEFTPETIEGELLDVGTSKLTLTGVLTIHGGEHPVSIPIEIENQSGRVSASANFVVPYVEWGLERPGVLFLRVAREVEVRFETAATLTSPATAPEE